jgi:FkbM family methyltransferase
MVDLTDLQRAGHSKTGRAWLTNPARRSALSVLRPFLLRLTHSISELESTTARHWDLEQLRRRTDALEHRANELAARPAQSGDVFKEELVRLGRALDGLRKDQIALNHTLGSLEDAAEEDRRTVAALDQRLPALGGALDELRREQAASLSRLGGIDRDMLAAHSSSQAARDEIAELRRIVAELEEKLELRTRSPRAPEGMSVLPQLHPVALMGTSLVLHAGPYGRFLLRQPDLISDHILAGSFWDSHLKPIIERTGRPDRSAIDAGAYLGFHSVYMSRYFRAVHAFEPQVEMYRMLCANLLLNNCQNAVAVNAALYDAPGYMRLADDSDQEIPIPKQDGALDYSRVGNAAALTFRPGTDGDGVSVQTLVIDQLGLDDVGLIKVDTQGSDLHVLRGARATIQKCRPHIVAEYERELARVHGNTLEDYHRFFDEIGYAVEVLNDQGEGKQVDLLATPR